VLAVEEWTVKDGRVSETWGAFNAFSCGGQRRERYMNGSGEHTGHKNTYPRTWLTLEMQRRKGNQ